MAGFSWPNSLRMRWACVLSAWPERSSGRLLVQRLAGPGHEGGGDAQGGAVGGLQQVGRAGHVPGGVAARLAGGADAAVGEAGGVGLALDQRLAGELGDGAALAVGREEAVVLLGAQPGQRVEDVRVVGGALATAPRPSSPRRPRRRRAGSRALPVSMVLLDRAEDLLGQLRLHGGEAEDVGAEQGRRGGLLVVEGRARSCL